MRVNYIGEVDCAAGCCLIGYLRVIWLADGDPLARSAMAAILHAGVRDRIFISPTSAWEVGLLNRPKTGPNRAVRFMPDPKTWFARVMSGPGIREASLTPAIAIDASFLPGELHGDPGDRLIVTSARHLGVPIVTRDRSIIAYGRDGHVQVIPC
jgi:PIN domain nuclease of toxin-antitoxin system